MSAALQLLGAVLVLLPFAWSQLGALRVESAAYLTLNLAGASLLAALALIDRQQWGFLLLEGSWALVSLRGLVALARSSPRT